ncbi:hypothetical protein DAPPUDRAFT_258324 [Daphnia pulex]|uniref:MADF domain-containing protein n=1 Tax=Daphnia pulex TaxID=6669 RepID=E9HF71_DAPPU|nr:hypothetical protein DAPPUDRAFT_272076 [Daphnia pulex]EFX69610.1 hypothetical protein DAPPUDRAFT_258324 [Daphnia pulex]|eukprot:EFX61727.1 hypothetical protein DAPPUDRAFT_272076 [Daphnia pulex]
MDGSKLILRDMGLASYVTPYQAQKKWNNLWSKYKLAKRAQFLKLAEGPVEEDPNGVWPFFTVLDAIATGKTVAITSPGVTLQVAVSETSGPVIDDTAHNTVNASAIQWNDAEPPSKKSKLESEMSNPSNALQWDGETINDDHKQQIVELLQANLQQLDEFT